MTIENSEHVSVLIVGGGIVGLSAALFLLKHAIPFVLVERHASTSIHPRSRGVNGRTMELYREIGLDEAVREAGAGLAPAMGFISGATLVEALADFNADQARTAFAGMVGTFGEMSPTSGARVTQDMLEPVLLARARERGGDLRFSTELLSFAQDHAGVTAQIADRVTGTRYSLRADYMLAIDGANSPIRRQLHATVSGRGSLGHLLNILFKADLRAMVRGREFSICNIANQQVRGLFTSINLSDTWVFHMLYDPSETPAQFSSERSSEHYIKLLRRVLGLPNLDIEIKSIQPWESAMRVVDNFQHGRVFFAGDAAHQMPPWGGQGANSGIADVHNLAWKLAAVLKGHSDPALLSTYQAERHPVDYLAADESAAAADEQGLMQMPGMRAIGAARFPRILGYYTYQDPSQAILAEPESAPSLDPLGLDGRPGTRVPHAWIEKQGQHISTLDLSSGTHFVLLTGTDGTDWYTAAQKVAQHLAIELDAYRIGPDGDLLDTKDNWLEKAGIPSNGALLIRPDGIVAWRSREPVADPQLQLTQVLSHLLCQKIIS